MCSITMQCSSSSIPTSKVKTFGDYVVPGFNEYAKELHKETGSCFIACVAIALLTIAITHLHIISIQIAIMSIVKPCLHITMK